MPAYVNGLPWKLSISADTSDEIRNFAEGRPCAGALGGFDRFIPGILALYIKALPAFGAKNIV